MERKNDPKCVTFAEFIDIHEQAIHVNTLLVQGLRKACEREEGS